MNIKGMVFLLALTLTLVGVTVTIVATVVVAARAIATGEWWLVAGPVVYVLGRLLLRATYRRQKWNGEAFWPKEKRGGR